MAYASVEEFLRSGRNTLRGGPIAMIFVEDDVEIASTVSHHLDAGFATVLVLMPDAFELAEGSSGAVHRIGFDMTAGDRLVNAVNAISAAAPGQWFYYGYNAEYLFHPFRESRTIGELLAFHSEERRDAVLAYTIDLYADDLERFPNAVSLDHAHLDKSGYYALARTDPDTGETLERQHDFHGGLRWRFEEHIPGPGRKIDRIALFRSKPGLSLGEDHTFNDPEYNTFSCPWHHNITVAVCSFRTAKALKRNPGSSDAIDTFQWHNSTRFAWQSGQLLDLGLMEPGQWF